MAEAPPPILEFSRYEKHLKPVERHVGLHATRIQLGELIDEAQRPPSRYVVPEGHMQLYNSYRDMSKATVGDMVGNAEAYHTFAKTAEDTLRRSLSPSRSPIPRRPLTCSGLSLRKHPLTSTPTMGIRRPTSPQLPLRPWKPPTEIVSFNEEVVEAEPAYALASQIPDSFGAVREERGIWSKTHASKQLDHLDQHPHRLTEWSKQNVYNRKTTYKQRRIDRVGTHVPRSLYTPTNEVLQGEDFEEAQDIRDGIREIARLRHQLELEKCGKTSKSRRRRAQARQLYSDIQRRRKQEVDDHIKHHEGQTLAYRIAFEKYDVDGSGTIDTEELSGALRHMGLSVPEDSVSDLLSKYDEDSSGALSFDEFSQFAKDAQFQPEVESLFLPKSALMKSTR